MNTPAIFFIIFAISAFAFTPAAISPFHWLSPLFHCIFIFISLMEAELFAAID
jgi:hypothetical protein